VNLGRPLAALFLLASTLSCSGTQRRPTEVIAPRCEVHHRLEAGDEEETRIDRLSDGWLVSLHMRVRVSPDTPPIEIRGLGRVTLVDGELQCDVAEASGAPGSPRFDSAVCLDEIESVSDLLEDAQESARPGETVVQEVRLRTRRRHRRRARSRVAVAIAPFRERAEVTRDAEGRVVRLVRTTNDNGREEILVDYPAGVAGRCIPAP
jgi:hypothetical protein